MPAPNAISNDKLFRLIGTPRAPLLLDVRSDEDYEADPRLIPLHYKRERIVSLRKRQDSSWSFNTTPR